MRHSRPGAVELLIATQHSSASFMAAEVSAIAHTGPLTSPSALETAPVATRPIAVTSPAALLEAQRRLAAQLTTAEDVRPQVVATVAAGQGLLLAAAADRLDRVPETRRHLHLGADLLGAVRLPAGTLRQLPGLDLPTDLLVLQRRPEGVSTRSQDFELTTTIHVDDRDVEINTYFDDHADQVLGTVGADPLAWGPAAITVSSTPDRLDQDLAKALGNVTTHALRTGLTYTPGPARPALPDPSVAELIRRHHHREAPTPSRPHLRRAEGRGLER